MESEDGTPPAVVVKRIGESYWGKTRDGNMIEFAQLREHSDGMTAEVKAFTQTGGKYWARVTLVSSRSRQEFARAALRITGVDWDGFLDLACEEVVRAERTGTPAVALVATRPAPNRWLVPNLFPLGETSTLYGDSGTGKSLLALALAVCRPHGSAAGGPRAVAGGPPARRAVPRLGKPGHRARRADLGPHPGPHGPAHHPLLPKHVPPAHRDDARSPARGRQIPRRPRHRGQQRSGLRERARGGRRRDAHHERAPLAPRHAGCSSPTSARAPPRPDAPATPAPTGRSSCATSPGPASRRRPKTPSWKRTTTRGCWIPAIS